MLTTLRVWLWTLVQPRVRRPGSARCARLVFICAILGVLLGSGCDYVEPVDEQTIREAFPFLRDGQTTKKEVLDRFGEPSHSYEGGRIITYDAGCAGVSDGHGRLPLVRPPCRVVLYSLILVFGPDDVLERHSAVLERPL